MPKGVSCSVSNCTYWGQGNNCHADEIMIDVDSHAHDNFKAEFAEENYISEHKDAAKESAGTCCHTFKPKQ
ncbi:DUF1540 domain-containing protein [Paenibacillus sp. sptzw28]|uniref:DUF1540 domain-containing protein n=1 Tax=Paenibacillus sp. sptzw28 TaxID=715179 RepID=UPI001C6F392A|nr:DUF1540 domain-containing protein [Paenibacillus sp. sptzw28]QYR20119.1 DUF1540 domain-containing protein [Paenibacillus sp. sptzw28]